MAHNPLMFDIVYISIPIQHAFLSLVVDHRFQTCGLAWFQGRFVSVFMCNYTVCIHAYKFEYKIFIYI